MKIILTNHVRERMRERGISEKEIMECVQYPDEIFKESERICRFQKVFPYGILKVVGEIKGGYFVVVTAYPL